MQRDIDLTIGDIIVEGIRSYALSQFSEDIVSQDTHTNLRFFKIINFEQYTDLYPKATCELTEKGIILGKIVTLQSRIAGNRSPA